MLVDDDGTLFAGFPEFGSREPHHVSYPNCTGEPVYHVDDAFGDDCLGYDLPPSHEFSVFYERSRCAYCGVMSSDFSSDHIVPYAKGGAHLMREFSSVDNRADACDDCNSRKGAKLGWKTLDGRTGFFWDGTPGDHENQPALPDRARKRR